MSAEIVRRLEKSTGRGLGAWVTMVRTNGDSTRKQNVEWLIAEHGLGRVAANVIASHAEGNATDYNDQEGLLEAMYAGAKSQLRPIYDRLVEKAEALGPDFSLYQCASQTTLKRNRQFAWIKPATRTRVDLGLALPVGQASGRLLPVTGTNDKDRVRLRIALSSVSEIDDEVAQLIKRAWDLDAQVKKS